MGNQTRIQSKITLKFQSALHEEEIVKFLFKRKKYIKMFSQEAIGMYAPVKQKTRTREEIGER